MNSSLTFIILR